jgi:hypothetical protein
VDRFPAPLAEAALFLVRELADAGGAGSFTPERRAFERPIAIACFVDRAPCLPSRTWWISSRTNSPACVVGAFPCRLSLRARSIVAFSGIAVLLGSAGGTARRNPPRVGRAGAGRDREYSLFEPFEPNPVRRTCDVREGAIELRRFSAGMAHAHARGMETVNHYTKLFVWTVGDQIRQDLAKLTSRPAFARDLKPRSQADEAANSVGKRLTKRNASTSASASEPAPRERSERLGLLHGLDSEHGSLFRIGNHVQQSIRSLLHVADSLTQIDEQ